MTFVTFLMLGLNTLTFVTDFDTQNLLSQNDLLCYHFDFYPIIMTFHVIILT